MLVRIAAGCVLWAAVLGADRPTAPAADKLDPDHAAKMAKGQELFKQHVRPILVKRCLSCHGGKEEIEAGFSLVDRPGLLRGGDSGPAIIPGNAKDSLLYKLITHAKEPYMPQQSRKLTDEQIAHIAAWIDLGAPYDSPLVEVKDTAAWTRKEVPPEAKQFWSFQPLRRAVPPRVQTEAWVRTPIDRFILAKLETAGIAPNPPADRRTLIRRAYFDLIGLPPAPEEVEAFLSDPAPDAYEKLIDRLLASPHYGERWGRHWLDLVRFAESHGFEHDYDRPSAYHYRDFVIRALNEDWPYTTFVKWQLAGDEYEPENRFALMATGFLAAGVHSTQITKREVEKHRYDALDDMLATTGTAFLGLTIGCARCHDHKYDPIPQADYYRLLATFTTTVRSEMDVNFDPDGYRQAKAAFDREHEPLAAALAQFEAEQLPARLAAWEKSWANEQERFQWVILDPVSFTSEGGATFTKQDDGSLLAGGKNPDFDTYTLTVHTDLTNITSIRLEALADPSLVKNGPGRAKNGNFALTDLRLTIAPKTGDAKPVTVQLRNPRATFEQKGLPVAAAIDGDEKSGWAVDPQFGKDHAAVFAMEKPVGFDGGSVLTVTLKFKNNAGHQIGRPRLSISTAAAPVSLTADAIPQSALTALSTPRDQRTAEQSAALLRWYRTIDPEWRRLNARVQEHLAKAPKPNRVKVLVASEGVPAVRLHTQGDDFLPETFFLRRGDPDQKEAVATQGFLQVLTSAPAARWQTAPPPGWRTSYRRRALAEWITDTEHGAGQLLARVIVNRLWQHHLGRGIVATPSDFGARGERPTHPELLDWLAAELIANGWRLKPIHKQIMLSAVYQQSGTRDEAKLKIDPDNRLFWRRPSRRLEAEIIRDTMLAVSGVLDRRQFGPGTLDPASLRRSVYFTVKRSKLVPMMTVFDAPDALGSLAERPTTTVAPQALLLMNNPHVRGYAQAFARRLAPDGKTPPDAAITAGYLHALARPPSAEELADALAFIRVQTASYQAAGRPDASHRALADFCQVLFCLNEFIYVD